MPRNGGQVASKEDLLKLISDATSGLSGNDLLNELCRNFTKALKMQFALVAECIEEGSTHVRTLCFVNGDTVADNIEYDSLGRPCELILQGKEIFIPKDVYRQFPEAKGIEAATGVPIYSSVSGKIIGHIIVSNLSPVDDGSNHLPLMFPLFPGYEPVPMSRVVNAYRKSVLGPLTGQVFKVYC